jgi:hypothetical protein
MLPDDVLQNVRNETSQRTWLIVPPPAVNQPSVMITRITPKLQKVLLFTQVLINYSFHRVVISPPPINFSYTFLQY